MYSIGDIQIDDRPHRLRESGSEIAERMDLADGIEFIDGVSVRSGVDICSVVIEISGKQIETIKSESASN